MIATSIPGISEGERLKDVALSLLSARREALIRLGRRALLNTLLERGTATADDVRAAVEVPEGVDPKALGAVPGELATAGIIRRDGYVRTCRPEAHARPVSIWRMADASKAERWLATHPPLTEQETGEVAP